MELSYLCFLTCIQVSQEAGQVIWYFHLFQNFPQFIVIDTVKGFGIVNKAEIDFFFWNSLGFSMIQRQARSERALGPALLTTRRPRGASPSRAPSPPGWEKARRAHTGLPDGTRRARPAPSRPAGEGSAGACLSSLGVINIFKM